MQSIFILGREPALSLAEIVAVLKRDNVHLSIQRVDPEFAVIEHDELDYNQLMATLGGTVKIARTVHTLNALNETEALVPLITQASTARFGVSFYGNIADKKNASHRMGMTLKRAAKENGHVRLVGSRESPLSSATVLHEGLVTDGVEFVVVPDGNKFLVGATVAIQLLEEFAERDMGRPHRDLKSGMIPPKLARMLVNIAAAPVEPDVTILDPFCGGGTIAGEAIALGYKKIICSDIASRAVQGAKENLAPHETVPKFLVSDVHELAKHIPAHTVDAIVTEPYLGPPRRGNENEQALKKTADDLARLYAAAFSVFAKILKSGGCLVFVNPCFSHNKKWIFVPIAVALKKMGIMPQELLSAAWQRGLPHVTNHGTIIYARPGQFVGREIIVARAIAPTK